MTLVVSHASRVMRFGVVGVSNTLVTLGTYLALLEIGTPYLLAGALGVALGALNGYTWNRVWTWRAGRHHHWMLLKYASVTAAGIALSTVLLALLVELVGAAVVPAQILALPVVTLVTYAGNHHWTFKAPQNGSVSDRESPPSGRSPDNLAAT